MEDYTYINSIVEEYSSMILRIAINNLKNTADAEDIIQEVFIKLLKSQIHKDNDYLKAWLIRVTINLCKDYNKSAWIRKRVSLNTILEPVSKETFSLLDEIKNLPLKYRAVLYLYHYENYSVKEISDLLNINVNTIQSRLYRARKKLKKIILEEEL